VEKQTAVEWLVNQMKQRESQGLTLSMYELEMFAEQAKEMEKEQIIEAHKQSSIESGFEDSAEDWANEYWERNYKV
jgi:hypothetical protein